MATSEKQGASKVSIVCLILRGITSIVGCRWYSLPAGSRARGVDVAKYLSIAGDRPAPRRLMAPNHMKLSLFAQPLRAKKKLLGIVSVFAGPAVGVAPLPCPSGAQRRALSLRGGISLHVSRFARALVAKPVVRGPRNNGPNVASLQTSAITVRGGI